MTDGAIMVILQSMNVSAAQTENFQTMLDNIINTVHTYMVLHVIHTVHTELGLHTTTFHHESMNLRTVKGTLTSIRVLKCLHVLLCCRIEFAIIIYHLSIFVRIISIFFTMDYVLLK